MILQTPQIEANPLQLRRPPWPRWSRAWLPKATTMPYPAIYVAMAFAASLAPLTSALDPPPAVPPAVGTLDDLPGMRTCVSCNFMIACIVLACEIGLMWAVSGTW